MLTRSSCELLPTTPETSWRFVVERGREVEPLRFEPQGDQGVGTLNHLGSKLLRPRFTAVSRTTEWDPPFRCAFESVRPRRPVTATITEEFAPHEFGGTRHTIPYEVTPTGSIGRLVAPLVASVMIRNRQRYQRRPRAALEQAHDRT